MTITVVIPVGPDEHHARWLPECLNSIRNQTLQPSDVILIDDMHGFTRGDIQNLTGTHYDSMPGLSDGSVGFMRGWRDSGERLYDLRVWHAPWHLGVPAAFNMGVGLARSDLVVMLGADDWLQPEALAAAVAQWEAHNRNDAYYWFTIRYSDNREIQALPCNCAVVTPGLWKLTGGFPPESAVGACDTMLISMLLRKRPELLVPIRQGDPLYEYRRHQETDTATRPVSWQGPIFAVRDILTETWEPPAWRGLK